MPLYYCKSMDPLTNISHRGVPIYAAQLHPGDPGDWPRPSDFRGKFTRKFKFTQHQKITQAANPAISILSFPAGRLSTRHFLSPNVGLARVRGWECDLCAELSCYASTVTPRGLPQHGFLSSVRPKGMALAFFFSPLCWTSHEQGFWACFYFILLVLGVKGFSQSVEWLCDKCY